ncbi:MFS transporter [Paenibacillus sp. IB182496]|uniref:MFS transporter n=1 Tax=Paenibacillus sabuli TaxID=2772509 RepID=A0A927BRD3_9BACL|nr:MFS transporter [Paenibacillus sabuli]MBD2845353.1 MFS transporter [Paenibacillus sabuli]
MSTPLHTLVWFYFFVYMVNAVYGTFAPVYFEHIGFSNTQIGLLLSVGPLVAVLAQPFWGTVGDRAQTKNSVLMMLLGGSAICMLVFPLSGHFIFVLVLICLYMFFQTPVFAVGDAITLEVLDRRGSGNFSLIRMGGTFGFAIMSVVFGFIANEQVGLLFPVNAAVFCICLLLVLRFPRVEGHQSHGVKMHMGMLFRYRKLMLYMAASFLFHVTLGYYYSFFPLYFQELGATNAWVGWSMLVSSLSEIPFLLLSAYLFKRVRISYILLGAGIATAVRWYVYSIIENPWWMFPAQALHGVIFIVLTVTMAIVINREVPGELKASGQTLHALLCLGVARMIGSFFGGITSDAIGMRETFFYNSLLAGAGVIVFGAIFWIKERKEGTRAAA